MSKFVYEHSNTHIHIYVKAVHVRQRECSKDVSMLLVIPFDRDILCEVQFPKATQECTLYNYISNLYCITPFTLSK